MNPIDIEAFDGLTDEEANERLLRQGPNEIRRDSTDSPVLLLLKQFRSPLILILIAAAAASVVVGYLPGQSPSWTDSILILVIVVLSAIFGFVQEYKAEKAVEALRQMAAPLALVIRRGRRVEIPASEIVQGDVILVGPGNRVPADAVLLSGTVQIDESVLTGESVAVARGKDDAVRMGTYVTEGNAAARVTATGGETEVGRIAESLGQVREEGTVFERDLDAFGKRLSIGVIAVGVVVAIAGYFRFDPMIATLQAIALMVAAVPEGLPAVVVVTLALSARRMYSKNALIRRLGVVESVGSVDVICTDKTGTLTMNSMTVVQLFAGGVEWDPFGEAAVADGSERELLLTAGVVCNNAGREEDENGEPEYFGTQTEVALLRAVPYDFRKRVAAEFERVSEIPFNPERKMMSVAVRTCEGKGDRLFAKGAPEVILNRCSHYIQEGVVRELDADRRRVETERFEGYASSAMRVLGFAFRDLSEAEDAAEEGLIWIGVAGMIDPPRPEVQTALADCMSAGIRVIMITGDNGRTAQAIAELIGLTTTGVLTGSDIEGMTDNELSDAIAGGVNVFARTTPFHKLRILECIRTEHRVAMTGDGVNDALALKRADVGIAMGRRGTEVAKESGDIILLDDNFASIAEAVREGRTVRHNIRKFVNYLFSSNLAEITVIFVSTLFFDLPSPILLPIQLLWINLITDGAAAAALGVDPAPSGIMRDKPQSFAGSILDRELVATTLSIGILIGLLSIATFLIVLPNGFDLAGSTLFTGFVIYEFTRIATIRRRERLGPFSNPWLAWALGASLILQIVILYSPLNVLFGVVPLGLFEWGVLGAGMIAGYLLAPAIVDLISARMRSGRVEVRV